MNYFYPWEQLFKIGLFRVGRGARLLTINFSFSMPMDHHKSDYIKSLAMILGYPLLLIGLILVGGYDVWAKNQAITEKSEISTRPAWDFESELVQAEKDMALRLEELDKLQKQRDDLQKALETSQSALSEAESSGIEKQRIATLDKVQKQQKELAALSKKIRTKQLLYNQAFERYTLISARQKLYQSLEESGSTKPMATQLADSDQVLKLIDKEIALIEKTERILMANAEILSTEISSANEKLKLGKLNTQAHRALEQHRNERLDELQAVESQVSETRKVLAQAKARRQVLAEEAQLKSVGVSQWRSNIIWSAFFIAIVVILLMLVRIIVTKRIKDAQRRYYLNRSISILSVFVVIIGLLVIFVRDFRHLATGMGVALAGLAVALQEMITSFFSWFLIRGSRGYQVGDWIRIGDQYGEAVDISLMLTTLGEVSPIGPKGETGGGWTGGLTILSNSIIFKSPLVNFTRGYPFVWCSLPYFFSYESDWKKAESILLSAAEENEIKETAGKAKLMIDQMKKDFAIRVRHTDPVVRVGAGSSGIKLTLRFLAHPRHRRTLMDRVNRKIMEAVIQADQVEFAYDTIRVFQGAEVGYRKELKKERRRSS